MVHDQFLLEQTWVVSAICQQSRVAPVIFDNFDKLMNSEAPGTFAWTCKLGQKS